MSVSQKIVELQAAKRKKSALTRPSFFKGVKEEMKKVSWTTKTQLACSAKIVIGAIFALGVGIYAVDLTIRAALVGIGLFVRFLI